MTSTDAFEIVEAGILDRPALARLSPSWFKRHRVAEAWCAVADGEVVAAAMLSFGGEGVATFEFNGCDPETSARTGPGLIERVIDSSRSCGAKALDAEVNSIATARHESLLRSAGFEMYESFDRYEVERETIQGILAETRRRIGDRIKSRFDVRIERIEVVHLDAVAQAWGAWIGGSVNQRIFRMREGFHRRRKDDPEANLQLVAIHENTVVGFCCTRIIDSTVLEIDGEAVHPRFRLDPLQGDLSWAMYEEAERAGIDTIRFEAGSLQPNTMNMVRRNGIKSVERKLRLRRSL